MLTKKQLCCTFMFDSNWVKRAPKKKEARDMRLGAVDEVANTLMISGSDECPNTR